MDEPHDQNKATENFKPQRQMKKKEKPIISYKGFDKDLKCRDFQYEIGKEYETDKAEACSTGFHACENPLDVFSYYSPSDSRYCVVEQSGRISKDDESDSKVASTRIKLNLEIGLPGLIKAGVEYILSKVDFDNNKESNTGDRSAATNTGYYSAATNTGNRSAATNTGDRSAATNTGYYSAATNTGERSAAEVSGNDSVAIVTGYDSKAKGSTGCWIVLTERDHTMKIVCVKAFEVDGKEVKADTYYKLVNKNIVEA